MEIRSLLDGMEQTLDESFSEFMADKGPRIQQALMASLGPDAGQEAAAEAFSYGWEHWERLVAMENPAGYLYRVGRTRGRRLMRRLRPGRPSRPMDLTPWVEPALAGALEDLTEMQRVATLLVHAGSWSFAEVGELLGVDRGTVKKHAERGLAKLRLALGVSTSV